MNKILEAAKKLLDDQEIILDTLTCSVTGYIVTNNAPRPGILLATDKRIIFYGQAFMHFKNELIEEFKYEKILSIEKKRKIFDKKIIIYYKDEYIMFGQILSQNIEEFIEVIKMKSNI
ncbi:PH domain-containing protein [Bacillus cereus]|uniref:PH domain-containing protein n=1 Tax=Bacillus cereus TaxID=1396 RepID=UPI000D9191CA|nr:PH domain-containing protein [Bacillus cereus]PYD94876.1 PlcR-regulated protein PRP2 [Bacillus cereus]